MGAFTPGNVNVARKDQAQTFTETQTIAEGKEFALGASGRLFTSGNSSYFGHNVRWDGSNWVRTMALNHAWLATIDQATGDFYIRTSTDAGNTVGSVITLLERFRIGKNGQTNLRGAAGRDALVIQSGADDRLEIDDVGKVKWRPAGGGAADTNLERAGVAHLRTNGRLSLAGSNSFMEMVIAAPEGSVTAQPGSFVMDVVNGRAWVKRTGTGNTGWVEV